ncbi:MAG: site-specific integrase, partial [Pseudomonadota bacterium]|nr:site-specific integrase [Pseudomonadota bacterium]
MGGSGNRTAWLAWLESERRYGANTLAAYESDLDDYLSYAGGDAGSAPPDRRRFRGWLADMAGRGLARTTVARRVSALRSFYRFCGRTDRININDLSWLRAPRPPKSVPKPVSEEDARALLAAIFRRRGDDWAKQRDFALLMILYGSGLRISEALDLTRRDVPLG